MIHYARADDGEDANIHEYEVGGNGGMWPPTPKERRFVDADDGTQHAKQFEQIDRGVFKREDGKVFREVA